MLLNVLNKNLKTFSIFMCSDLECSIFELQLSKDFQDFNFRYPWFSPMLKCYNLSRMYTLHWLWVVMQLPWSRLVVPREWVSLAWQLTEPSTESGRDELSPPWVEPGCSWWPRPRVRARRDSWSASLPSLDWTSSGITRPILNGGLKKQAEILVFQCTLYIKAKESICKITQTHANFWKIQ